MNPSQPDMSGMFKPKPGPPRPFRISKKLSVAIGTVVVLMFVPDIDAQAQITIAGVVSAYLVGQGVADLRR